MIINEFFDTILIFLSKELSTVFMGSPEILSRKLKILLTDVVRFSNPGGQAVTWWS